jgi:CheY-like chemotaxis protein
MPTQGGRVVLLVEPHDDTREMYAEFFRHHRFTPVAVGDGEAALKEASRADVVVTGICLPGTIDGVELIARLRRAKHTKHTPIVVLTASTLRSERERAKQAGCDGFLLKPCLPDDLLTEIRRVIAYAELPGHPRTVVKARLLNRDEHITKRSA